MPKYLYCQLLSVQFLTVKVGLNVPHEEVIVKRFHPSMLVHVFICTALYKFDDLLSPMENARKQAVNQKFFCKHWGTTWVYSSRLWTKEVLLSSDIPKIHSFTWRLYLLASSIPKLKHLFYEKARHQISRGGTNFFKSTRKHYIVA